MSTTTNGNGTSVRADIDRLASAAAGDDVTIDIRPTDEDKAPVHVMFNNAQTGARILDWWPTTSRTMDREKNIGRADTARHALQKAIALKQSTEADRPRPAKPPTSTHTITLPPTAPSATPTPQGTARPISSSSSKPRLRPAPALPLTIKDRRRLSAALLELAVGGNLEAARLLLTHAERPVVYD